MGLLAQIEAFMLTFMLGMMAGLIFHYYQSVIRSLRIGKYSLYLMDFILWILMIIFIAAALLLINQGEIRVYVFLALLVGGGAYYKCLAGPLGPTVKFLGQATAHVIQVALSALAKPFVLTMAWIKVQYRIRKRPPPPPDDTEQEI